MKKLNNQKGQSLVEYLILVSLIGVGSLVVVSTMGQNLNNRFAHVIASMGGKTEERIEAVTISKDAYQKRNLSNFMNNANPETNNNSQRK